MLKDFIGSELDHPIRDPDFKIVEKFLVQVANRCSGNFTEYRNPEVMPIYFMTHIVFYSKPKISFSSFS